MDKQSNYVQNDKSSNQKKVNTPVSMKYWNNLMFSSAPSNSNASEESNNSGNSNTIAIAGGWIEAIGTILAAIGNTPSTIFSQSTLTNFRLIGNALQAAGSALVAENEELLLDIVGDQLQAIGNITVIASILNENPQTSQLLGTQGNLLQLLGAGVSINTQENLSFIQNIDNIGNIIQAIGNAIQVLANTNTEEGITMNAVGSWVQAVGTVITAIAGDYDD